MKVKVSIYSEKSMSAPLSVLIDPIYGEVSSISEIAPLISSAMQSASAYITNQELITMVESYGIQRLLDIVSLQVCLRKQGLVLQVTEISTDPIQLGNRGQALEVISPVMNLLPVSTIFYDESGQYDLVEIVDEIITKFNVADPSLVPNSDVRTMITYIKDMKSKGMPVFPMYVDQLIGELMDYGFQFNYIYLE